MFREAGDPDSHGFQCVTVSSAMKLHLYTCRELECSFPYTHMGSKSSQFKNLSPVFMCDDKEKHLMDCLRTAVNITEEEQSYCANTHIICAGNSSFKKRTIKLLIKYFLLLNILYLLA